MEITSIGGGGRALHINTLSFTYFVPQACTTLILYDYQLDTKGAYHLLRVTEARQLAYYLDFSAAELVVRRVHFPVP